MDGNSAIEGLKPVAGALSAVVARIPSDAEFDFELDLQRKREDVRRADYDRQYATWNEGDLGPIPDFIPRTEQQLREAAQTMLDARRAFLASPHGRLLTAIRQIRAASPGEEGFTARYWCNEIESACSRSFARELDFIIRKCTDLLAHPRAGGASHRTNPALAEGCDILAAVVRDLQAGG